MVGFESLRGFRALSPAERDRVATATREQEIPKGTRIFTEGDTAEGVWAVKEGLVHIVKFGPAGREVVLQVIAPGELFGAVAALERRSYPAAAVAAETSTVWSIPASLGRELCQKHPTLRAAILEQVTDRLRSAHSRLQSVALEPVEQRLARLLLELADKIGQTRGGIMTVRITRQELADMIGTTVETAIRVTSKWQRAGIVRSSRNELALADRDRLAAIASRGRFGD